jgi:photosystem II stability/assembly factor-like uncharacterized protein
MNYLKIFVVLFCFISLLIGCKKEVIADIKNAKIVFVSGQNQIDTAGNNLKNPIIAKVIDSISGEAIDSIFMKYELNTCIVEPARSVFFQGKREFFSELDKTTKEFSTKVQLDCNAGEQTMDINVTKLGTSQVVATAKLKLTALLQRKKWGQACCFGEAHFNAYHRMADGTIFIGLEKGLMKTLDGGLSWQTLKMPEVGEVTQVYGMGSKIVINVHTRTVEINSKEDENIYVSNDNGNTWSLVGTSKTNKIFQNVRELSIGKSGKILFVGNNLPFSTADNGKNWYPIINYSILRLYEDNFRNIHYTDTNGHLYTVKETGILLSKNSISNTFGFIQMLLNDEKTGQIIAVKDEGLGSKIYSSTDGGNTWNVIYTSTYRISGLQKIGNTYVIRGPVYFYKADLNFNIVETIPNINTTQVGYLAALNEKKFIGGVANGLPFFYYCE